MAKIVEITLNMFSFAVRLLTSIAPLYHPSRVTAPPHSPLWTTPTLPFNCLHLVYVSTNGTFIHIISNLQIKQKWSSAYYTLFLFVKDINRIISYLLPKFGEIFRNLDTCYGKQTALKDMTNNFNFLWQDNCSKHKILHLKGKLTNLTFLGALWRSIFNNYSNTPKHFEPRLCSVKIQSNPALRTLA